MTEYCDECEAYTYSYHSDDYTTKHCAVCGTRR